METVPDIMFTLDIQANLVKWNRRLVDVTGYSPEELLSKPALAFVPPEEQARTAATILRAFTEGYAELDGHLLTKDCRAIPYHVTGALLKDSHGEPIGITGIGRDVSDKKRAEEDLRQQRRHLVEAQALAHLGSWEWELDSGEMQWSDEQCRIFGHKSGSIGVTHETLLAALLPDDHDLVLAAINDALLGKSPYDIECRIVRPNGEVRFIHVRGDVHRDATGHPLSMAGTVLDITERKQSEELLRASEERWHLAVRGSNDGIWDWNVRTGEVYFSVRWKAMRGYEESELANSISEWQSRIHPDDLERVLQRIDQYLAKQRPEYCEEYRVERKDGSYMWILDRGMAVWADDGTPLRMAGSETDITERQRTEEALRQSEERFALAVEGSTDILWDASRLPGEPWYAPQTPVWWSPRVRVLLGLEESESFETFEQWAVRLHPDDKDRVIGQLAAHIEHRVPYDAEYRLRTNRGDYRWIHGRGHALWDDQGEPRRMSGSCQDITERKQTEEALAQSERQLRTVLNALPVGVWFTDRSGKPLFGNPAAKEIWSNIKQIGLQTQDNQSSWWEAIGPAREPHRWALSRVLTTGVPSLGETFDLECLDGTKKVIRNSTVPVQNEAGVTLGAIVLNEDITMLRQAQAALQLTQFSVDHAVEGFFWIGPDARIFHVNESACRMLDYTWEELTTMTLHDIDPNLSSEVWPAHWEELKEKGSLTFESKYWSRTGRVLDTEVTVNYLQYEGKEYNCAIMRDITERKQLAEREVSHVRQLKKLYELSMTLSGDPGVVLEHAVRIIGELFNVQVVCLSEIVGQELYFKSVYVNGQTVMDAGHCSLAITPCATVEHSKDLRMFDRVMERFPQASFLRDYQAFSYCGFPALNNEERVVAVTCLLDNKPHEFSKEEQDLLRIFGQRIAVEIERSRHVAEQKRAADELRRSHAFIRQIIDIDPHFIFAKDRDGRFTLVNKAVADAYGTTVDELIGRTDADFNPNQEEVEFFRQKDLEVMDSLHERTIPEEVITDSTGRTRWLQTVKRPIFDEQGRAIMVLGAATDITDRKVMEEALRQRERDLRAALDEREQISQDLHDGILQSLFAVGLALETSKSMMSPRVRKTSGASLNQAIDQLNLVMREIRNFIAGLGSELLQGKDLPTALQNMLASLTENQPTRVRLVVEDRAAKAVTVEQAFHLFRVIQESVSNCIRHGGAQEARVSLKMLKQGVRLSIRDNGRGFSPDAAKRTGHGLGNMAARAQKIGGRFTVLSKVNKGTSIVLDLPKEAVDVRR
jgi:PAS domain S-box-containing protein